MKMSRFWFVLLLIMLPLVACYENEPEGGGTLPEHGEELVANFVAETKRDDSGGRIVYIKDAPPENEGENLWCVNVRYVNLSGIDISALLLSQRGEEWRVEKNPKRSDYEAYGCIWPVANN